MSQMELADLDSLVSSTHPSRRFQAYLPDSTEAMADVRHLKGAEGYGVEWLFRCLLVQFMEDLSDRELARYLEENLAAKWLRGFTLSEPTPGYSHSPVSAPVLGPHGSHSCLPVSANNSRRRD
jgi:transposase, IS5 family